jgi:hypothetical protein
MYTINGSNVSQINVKMYSIQLYKERLKGSAVETTHTTQQEELPITMGHTSA